MAKSVKDILALIKEQGIKMVDFKMVDINGQYRHVTIPAENFSEDTMKSGIGFDASNYGYAVVEKSDMVFIPDPDTAVIDPFCSIPTLSMTGNAMIIDNPENRPLPQYPRNIIKAAVKAMQDSGVADTMYILPEFEFYLFDNVSWNVDANCVAASVDAQQSYWNSGFDGKGVIVPKQKNYHIAKPFDVSYECRSEMCMLMKEAGIDISSHTPKNVSIYLNDAWDYVITVCGGANETCPTFIGKVGKRLHIGFDDPSHVQGSEEFVTSEFRRVRDEIRKRISEFYVTEILRQEIPQCSCGGKC